jgi:hypothetical protein
LTVESQMTPDFIKINEPETLDDAEIIIKLEDTSILETSDLQNTATREGGTTLPAQLRNIPFSEANQQMCLTESDTFIHSARPNHPR